MKGYNRKDIVFIIVQLAVTAFAIFVCVEACETRKRIERNYEMRTK